MDKYDSITVGECLSLNEIGITVNINDGHVIGINIGEA